MVLETAGARLRQAREAAGFKTAAEAARHHKWNANSYKSHENGIREFSKRTAAVYAKAYRVSVGWLLTGESMGSGGIIRQIPFRHVPLIAIYEVGRMASGTTLKDAIKEGKVEYLVIDDDSRLGDDCFATIINDSSMLPTGNSDVSFRQGDKVVISKSAKIQPGDFVMFIDADGHGHLRRLRSPRPGVVELVPLNADYPTIVAGRHTKIVGRMMKHIRDY